MCGIAGIYNSSGAASLEQMQIMTQTLDHRGPDDQGVLQVTPSLAFGHTRLSIIDLSANGHQPMRSKDGRVSITYNGEIYNYKELRDELIAKGHTFVSESDTEVLLYAYYEWGEAAFKKLNGMFAFAIWDQQQENLYLVRDRFGIKPLYYYVHDNQWLFASEIKALCAHPDFKKNMSHQGLSEYLWYGVGLGQETLFANTKKLLPGTFLKINRNGMTQHTYWSIESVKRSRLSVTDAITETRARLEQSIQRHLRSDVPVGVFLSGGIDSSAITAFASQQMTRQLDTFAVSFDYDKGVNELEKAAFVANHFGTRHHELHVTGKDLPHIIETLIGAHDEPFADAANIPLYLLCQRVKGDVKVVLQGDGGDEIFAGYRRYNVLRYERLWRTLAWLSLPAFKCLPRHAKLDRLQRFLLTMRPSSADKRMAMLLTVDSALSMPTAILSPELQQAMASCNPFKRYAQCAERFKHEDPVQKMLFTDASILLADVFLEKVDKPTMANSIEVRVPFLDAELTELALSLPSSYKVRRGHKKWLLRQALRGLVPDQILDAPKMGFGVPIGYWLRTSLADYMKGVLLDRACPLFDRVKLEQLVQAHISGRADYAFLLWKALLLALWYQRYFADSYNSMTTRGNASYATTTAIA